MFFYHGVDGDLRKSNLYAKWRKMADIQQGRVSVKD